MARRGWAKKAGIALAVVAVLIVAGFGVASATLYWRLSDGPISLDSLKPAIVSYFDEEIGDARAEIGQVWLTNDEKKGLVVRLEQVQVFDPKGRQLVSAPEAAMGISLLSAVTGSLNPTSIELIGPHIRVRRFVNGQVELGFSEPGEQASSSRNGSRSLNQRIAANGATKSDNPGAKSDAGQFELSSEQPPVAIGVPAPKPKPILGTEESAGFDGTSGKSDLVKPQDLLPTATLAPSVSNSAAKSDQPIPAQPGLNENQNTQPNQTAAAGGFALSDAGILGSIDNLAVTKARLSVFDEAAGANWESYGAELHISRPDGGLLVDVDAPFLTDGGEWRIRVAVSQDAPGEIVGVNAAFDAVIPSEIAAKTPELAMLAGLDIPITGRVALAISPEFQLDRLSVDLNLGAGFISGAPEYGVSFAPTLIDEGRIRAVYLKQEQTLEIEGVEVMVGGNRFQISGTAVPDYDGNDKLTNVRYALRSEGLTLNAADINRTPLMIRRALATGDVNLVSSDLNIETISVELENGGALNFGGNLLFGGQKSLTLRGDINALTLDDLLQIWPHNVAGGARIWLAENTPKGFIPKGDLSVAMGEEDFAKIGSGQPIPNENLQLEFQLEGVTTAYLGTMPPVENASGIGILEADRFRLSMKDGTITTPAGSRLAVESGRFAVNTFTDEVTVGHTTGEIDVSIRGPLSGAMEILDMEPLGWAKDLGVVPTEVGGEAEINLDISLPLLTNVQLEQTGIQAGVRLNDLTVPGLFQGVDVNGGNLVIIATQREIDATGKVLLGGIDSDLKWKAKFDPNGGRTDKIQLNGIATPETLTAFGIDLADFVEGQMPIKLEATGQKGDIKTASVDADVTDAIFSVDTLGWSKPKGKAARLRLDIEELDNAQVRLRNIRLEGEGINVTGAIRLDPDGSLYKADLSQVKLGDAADLTINGTRGSDKVLRLKVGGASIDSRKALDGLFAGSDGEEEGGRNLDVTFDVGSVQGRNETDIQDAKGSLKLRNGRMESLRLNGAFASQRKIVVVYGRSGSRPAVLSVKTDDGGGFARMMGIYRKARGGSMVLDARSIGNGRLEGVVKARGFSVRDEPVFSQLAATQGVRNSGDITFSELQMRFRTNGDEVILDNVILNSPGMGARLDGRILIEAEKVSVKGTYVPAYGLNSIPAGIPIVGWLLTGRTGEGVVGMTFRVEGDMNKPNVQINPLSAIAPGILRSLFEFRGR